MGETKTVAAPLVAPLAQANLPAAEVYTVQNKDDKLPAIANRVYHVSAQEFIAAITTPEGKGFDLELLQQAPSATSAKGLNPNAVAPGQKLVVPPEIMQKKIAWEKAHPSESRQGKPEAGKVDAGDNYSHEPVGGAQDPTRAGVSSAPAPASPEEARAQAARPRDAAAPPATAAAEPPKPGKPAEEADKGFFAKALGFLKGLFHNPLFQGATTGIGLAAILLPGVREVGLIVLGFIGLFGLITVLGDWLTRDKNDPKQGPDWSLLFSSALMFFGFGGAQSIGFALAPIGSSLLGATGLSDAFTGRGQEEQPAPRGTAPDARELDEQAKAKREAEQRATAQRQAQRQEDHAPGEVPADETRPAAPPQGAAAQSREDLAPGESEVLDGDFGPEPT